MSSSALRPAKTPLRSVRPPRQCGLTLIEVVVALAIFAVLGTLTYRGTVHMLDTSAHIEAELAQWRAISRTFQLIETDLLHFAAPERPSGTTRAHPLQYQRGLNYSELLWLAHHPVSGSERIGVRFQQGQLHWLHYPEGTPSQQARVDVLLDAVEQVRWRFYVSEGWSEQWPPAFPSIDRLPRAIELQLQLPRIGTVTRVYALR